MLARITTATSDDGNGGNDLCDRRLMYVTQGLKMAHRYVMYYNLL